MPGVVTVRLPDGSTKELPAGATAGDLAEALHRLASTSASTNPTSKNADWNEMA